MYTNILNRDARVPNIQVRKMEAFGRSANSSLDSIACRVYLSHFVLLNALFIELNLILMNPVNEMTRPPYNTS